MAASADITTLPRRNFLRLASVPIVSMAAAGIVRPAPASAQDEPILAKAEAIKRLHAERDEADARWEVLYEEHERRRGTRPERLDPEALSEACLRVLTSFPEITPDVDRAVLAMRERTEKRQDAEWRAWNERSARLVDELGMQEAETVADDLYDRLEDAVEEMAALQARSLSGLIAKADVFAAVDRRGDEEFEFPTPQARLILSVLRDLSALGHNAGVA